METYIYYGVIVCTALLLPLVKTYFTKLENRISMIDSEVKTKMNETQVRQLMADKIDPLASKLEDIRDDLKDIKDKLFDIAQTNKKVD